MELTSGVSASIFFHRISLQAHSNISDFAFRVLGYLFGHRLDQYRHLVIVVYIRCRLLTWSSFAIGLSLACPTHLLLRDELRMPRILTN